MNSAGNKDRDVECKKGHKDVECKNKEAKHKVQVYTIITYTFFVV